MYKKMIEEAFRSARARLPHLYAVVDLGQHVANALLVGVVERGEGDHAPLVHQLSHRRVQPPKAGARVAVQLSCQAGRLREQEAIQRSLQRVTIKLHIFPTKSSKALHGFSARKSKM